MSTTRRSFLGGLFVGIAALGTGCTGSSDSGGRTATPTNDRSATATTPPSTTPTQSSPSPPTSSATTSTSTAPTDTAETPRTNTPGGQTRTTKTTEPTNDIPVWEPPACDEGVHRLSSPIDEVRYGSLGGFTLTTSADTIVSGETISFRLENTADAEKTTGNKRKYDIQRRTDDAWRSVYWVPEKYGYNDVGVVHPPGTGFTWEFPLTRDGLEQPTQFNTPYSVCEPLVPGEYRLVYWGVTADVERGSDFETESAIGVRFTVGRSRTATTESGY